MNNLIVKFYPIGNADCSLIKTSDNDHIIIDYAKLSDNSFDLAKEIKKEVGEEKCVKILSFSHMDSDHVRGASELFYLEHAKVYQSDDRVRIEELWVPAEAIVESNLEDDARAIRQEARYRLKEKKGIKVFGRPSYLNEYLESEESGKDIKYDDVKHLIYTAGTQFNKCGLDFFIHTPFSESSDDPSKIERNANALTFQVRTNFNGRYSNLLYLGDLDSDTISRIVTISEKFNKTDKLNWDILKVAHHGSYKALNRDDKGDKETVPTEEIKRLLKYGTERAKIVISSQPIDKKDYDRVQPPHVQAYNTYKKYAASKSQKIIVTSDDDTPISFTINENGINEEFKIPNVLRSTAAVIAPRVG